MTKEEIEEFILGLLKADTGRDDVTLDDKLQDDLGLDSLDALELTLAFEEKADMFLQLEEEDKIISAKTGREVSEILFDVMNRGSNETAPA